MKLPGAIVITGLSLLLGSTAAAYAPQEQSGKPEKQEEKAKPEKQGKPDKPTNRMPGRRSRTNRTSPCSN